jgi:hypothetical protein
MNILQTTTSSKGYVLFMLTHRAHTCERACVSGCVVTHSIISGRILFKFDGHILQMTTIYMGYIHIMFKHLVNACVCKRVCASARVIKCSLFFERILSKFGGDIQQIPRGYMSYLMYV